MRNDIEDKVENNNYMLESVARKDVLKATITLHNFLLQYENTTLDLFNALRKVRDEIKKKLSISRENKYHWNHILQRPLN
jgi:ribosome-associated translation inhibitor RaiA